MLFSTQKLLTTTQKSDVVLSYQTNFQYTRFIETGTYRGKMLDLVRYHFENLYSIEIGKPFFLDAHKRFQSTNVSVFLGDTVEILPLLLKRISAPIVFWLDAHYWPGSPFFSVNENCPIQKELQLISKHQFARKHVLLIDDYRCFIGKYGYPTQDELLLLLSQLFPTHTIEIADDIIRVLPISTEK